MIRSEIANRRWQKMAILKLNKIRIYYLNNTLLLAAYWWGINWCLVIHFCKNTYVARAAAGKFMHNCDKRERWHGKHPLALSRSTWCLIKISKWSKKYSYLLYYYFYYLVLARYIVEFASKDKDIFLRNKVRRANQPADWVSRHSL